MCDKQTFAGLLLPVYVSFLQAICNYLQVLYYLQTLVPCVLIQLVLCLYVVVFKIMNQCNNRVYLFISDTGLSVLGAPFNI